MKTSIYTLAHSFRQLSKDTDHPISLGHASQLAASCFGYKSLASYQAAQKASREPNDLEQIGHLVIDKAVFETRVVDLKITAPSSLLLSLLDAAMEESIPDIMRHHSFDDLEIHLNGQLFETAYNSDTFSQVVAQTNTNGIGSSSFDLSDIGFHLLPCNQEKQIDIKGYIQMEIDEERPYSGHQIDLVSTLSITRLGVNSFTYEDIEIKYAQIGGAWALPSHEEEYEDRPPLMTIEEAYADLLGLSLEEVEYLVDAEVQELSGNSGQMIYSYLIDFDGCASPEIEKKIIESHGSLQVEVDVGFFENIRSPSH